MQKRIKKGFTLAELLIVVAIIAVLTAIAVPLFVTSLGKAKEATYNANIDNLRTAGIISVLNDENIEIENLKDGDKIYVYGEFVNGQLKNSVAGDIKVQWVAKGATAKSDGDYEGYSAASYSLWNNGNCKLFITIDVAEVKSTSEHVTAGA